MKRSSTLLLLFALLPTLLSGQDGSQYEMGDSPVARFGLFGGLNIALHTAGFSALPGFPSCCPEYTSGLGLNPSIEGVYDLPLGKTLSLSIRAGYDAWGANLRTEEVQSVEQNGVEIPMTIAHEIRSNLGTIGAALLLTYPIGDRLRAIGGLRGGYVVGSDFVSDERIADESTRGTFENNARVRHEYAGDIPGASPILFGMSVGTSYELPLNAEKSWLAVPELTATLGLIPVSSEVSWNAHSVRLGVAIMHAPRSTPDIPQPPVIAEPTTPPPPLPPLSGSVAATGLGADGNAQGNVTMQIEEFVATEVRPMLGYIFFDEESAEIPSRYVRITPTERLHFDPNKIGDDDPLRVQHRSLDVIGYRMTEEPSARITIIGTNDGTARESRELSADRASSVADYLRDRWSIDPSRITTTARNLPATPSNVEVADGVAENRRAEITSTSPTILAPVRMADTLRHASPPTIRFTPRIISGEIASWKITAEQNGILLKEITGSGRPPESVDWTIDLEEESMPSAPGTIDVKMQLRSPEGEEFTSSSTSIDVRQITLSHKQTEQVGNIEIERYSLILFDFDRAELTPRHRTMIGTIKTDLDPTARVIVRGFTDRIGDPTRNRELALQRATNVARELGVTADRITIEAGESAPYDNNTPEGRFYSRTVQIEIQRPTRATDVE